MTLDTALHWIRVLWLAVLVWWCAEFVNWTVALWRWHRVAKDYERTRR